MERVAEHSYNAGMPVGLTHRATSKRRFGATCQEKWLRKTEQRYKWELRV